MFQLRQHRIRFVIIVYVLKCWRRRRNFVKLHTHAAPQYVSIPGLFLVINAGEALARQPCATEPWIKRNVEAKFVSRIIYNQITR